MTQGRIDGWGSGHLICSGSELGAAAANDAQGQAEKRGEKPSLSRLYQSTAAPVFEQEQSVFEPLVFLAFFGNSPVDTTIGASWSDTAVLDALTDDPVRGRNGVELSIFSEGETGLKLNYQRGPVTFNLQVPVEVTLELPANEVVAPQEAISIPTRWSNAQPDG